MERFEGYVVRNAFSATGRNEFYNHNGPPLTVDELPVPCVTLAEAMQLLRRANAHIAGKKMSIEWELAVVVLDNRTGHAMLRLERVIPSMRL